jgi:hypothetical protein
MKPKEAFKSFFTNVFSNKSAITSRAASYCAGSNLADRLRHAGIDSQGAIPINNDSGNMIALDGERGINVYKGEKLTVRLNLEGLGLLMSLAFYHLHPSIDIGLR